MKEIDIVSTGELLIDMMPAGSQQNNTVFEIKPGGAPCNVIAMAAKLGGRCAFIGKVGSDVFGDMLVKTLGTLGIECSGVVRDADTPTTLAVVSFDENNDRSFSFYRNPGADQMLRESEVNVDIIKNSRILHFGTMSLSGGSSRNAVMHAIKVARESEGIISFDPNIRMLIWKNETDLKDMLRYGLSNCSVLKMSEEEATYCAGMTDPDEAMDRIMEAYPNIQVAFLTLGERGCKVFFGGEKVLVAPVEQKRVIDTTGAGDAFYGVCLYHIAKLGMEELTMDRLQDIAMEANAAGSIVTGRRGSMCVMPTCNEIYQVLGNIS